jgi:hypothetical protein
MITPRDIEYVDRLAPLAQLLELLGETFVFDGGKTEQPVRRPEVFEATARDLWEVFFYLRNRLSDEAGHLKPQDWPESYFEEMARMARGARV